MKRTRDLMVELTKYHPEKTRLVPLDLGCGL